MKNDDFRDLIDVEVAPVKPQAKLPKVAVESLGAWQAHTSGIGLKLLQKFGFRGRLGANESGVSQAVAVKVRPSGQGLGFGGFKEASQLTSNKLFQAEWQGKDGDQHILSDENDEESSSDEFFGLEKEAKRRLKRPMKSVVETLADESGWKKGKRARKRNVVTVEDILNSAEGESKPKQAIIDMRGAQQRVITDLTAIGSMIMAENGNPKLGEELLFNISLIVDLSEINIMKLSNSLQHKRRQENNKKGEIDSLSTEIEPTEERIHRLDQMAAILNKINAKVAESSASLSISSLGKVFASLWESFQEEFISLRLVDCIPSLSRQILLPRLNTWDIKENPNFIYSINKEWDSFRRIFNDSKWQMYSQEMEYIFKDIMKTTFLPTLRKWVMHQWNPLFDESTSISIVLQDYEKFVDTNEAYNFRQTFILPKIERAIQDWIHHHSTCLTMDQIILPWLPTLGNLMSSLLKDVRQKLSHYCHLSEFTIADSKVLNMLKPWKAIFDINSWKNFVDKVIIPSIIRDFQHHFSICPSDQNIDLLLAFLPWKECGIFSKSQFRAILVSEILFPWLIVLLKWLSQSDHIATSEIVEWYEGWKGLFLNELHDLEVRRIFHQALVFMESYLESPSLFGSKYDDGWVDGLEKETYHTVLQRILLNEKNMYQNNEDYYYRNKSGSTGESNSHDDNEDGEYVDVNKPTKATKNNVELTFRDVVELFASDHEIVFLPRNGNLLNNKQLWSFGNIPCYLDQDVVFALSNKSGQYEPTSLQDLLSRVQGK